MLVYFFTVFTGSFAVADESWEYFSQYKVSLKTGKKTAVVLKPELRFEDNMSHFYYQHAELGLDYKLNPRITLGIYYRPIKKLSGEKWQREDRPHLNVSLKWEKLDMSNRLEYRIKESDTYFKYRNRVRFNFPEVTFFQIKPYIADEIFYDFEESSLNKNRIYFGANINVSQKIKGGLFYIYESSLDGGSRQGVNIAGTSVGYKFN